MLHRSLSTVALISVLLSVTAVHAQEDANVAVADQIGQDNAAQITQTGRQNQAGSDADPILQQGYYNALRIDQLGVNNRIGLEGSGVDQIGDAAIPSIFNQITVEQSSDDNVVGSIRQAAQGAIPEGANRLFLLQGDGGLGDGNRITTVVQEQLDGMPGQIARVEQTGAANTLVRLEQRSETAAEFAENVITARFSGSNNGRGNLTGPALLSRAEDNALIQRIGYDNLGANGNLVDLTISGDFNRFGIFQGGRQNSVGFVTLAGNQNELGLRQDGFQNDITMSTVQGDSNRIGLGQIGSNIVFLDLIGASDSNDVLGLQEGTNNLRFYVEGSLNILSADQGYSGGLGGNNAAEFRVIGEANFFDLVQQGDNIAEFVVEGNFNNTAPATGFSGVAAVYPELDPGTFRQIGMDNALHVSVIGDQNLVGALQSGTQNNLIVQVRGDLNQAAVIQNGSLNDAWLSQTGGGNKAGILQ